MKKKKNTYIDDMLKVFESTNEKGFAFYVTEIENDPRNEGFISKYKESLTRAAIDPQTLLDEQSQSLSLTYFQMLYNGYMEFVDRYMSVQKTKLNKEIVYSFGVAVQKGGVNLVGVFMDNWKLETEPEIIFELVSKGEVLNQTQYEDLKSIAQFVCYTRLTSVTPFLKKYQAMIKEGDNFKS